MCPSDLAEKIAKMQSSVGKYNTTLTDCNCPHHRSTVAVCKHMIAFKTIFGGKDAEAKTTQQDH